VRAGDEEAIALVGAIDHGPTRLATAAERAFLRRLGGGCHAAVAALGQVKDGRLHLRGLVADLPDRSERLLRGETEGPAREAEALGHRLAQQLMAEGAAALLEAGP
jgi:hydroxymethylbilane synthase